MVEAGFGAYWDGSDRLIPDKGDLRDYWIEISSDRDFLGPAPSYVLIRDPVRRLCHRMIAYSISGKGQAPEKVTGVDLFYLRSMDRGTTNVPHPLAQYRRKLGSFKFSVLTPLCYDDIHDVTPRVSALAGCDRLVSEPMVIEKLGGVRVAREDDRGVTEGREDVREVFQQRGEASQRGSYLDVEGIKWIVTRRANGSIVSITESDYKNLNKNDIEDLYLLIVNGKVDDYAETRLFWSLSVFIRSTVIWERVHDFQLVVESY
ncbi:hypothetical protein Tco_0397489 [Tanacetum coccineum]